MGSIVSDSLKLAQDIAQKFSNFVPCIGYLVYSLLLSVYSYVFADQP